MSESLFNIDDNNDVKQLIKELMINIVNSTIGIKYVNPKLFNSQTDTSAAVFSVLTCVNTWNMFYNIQVDRVLYIAITEPNCPRLPENKAITIPLIKEGDEIPQLILDLRSAQKIKWKSSSIFIDSSVGIEGIGEIMKAMSRDLPGVEQTYCSTVLYRIEEKSSESERRKYILEIMKQLPKEDIPYNFLLIVKVNLVGVIVEVANSLNMVISSNQWLFVIPDTDPNENVTVLSNYFVEGGNIAFIFKSSTHNTKCTNGLKCHVKELFTSVVAAINKSLHEELTLSQTVSEEEWLMIKPSQFDRKDSMLKFVKNEIHERQKCNNCTLWKMMAGEFWGLEFFDNTKNQIFDVGFWNPREGPYLSDELFPHSVHGFRGRNLPLASFHFPPWQILTTNETQVVVNYKGLVFEIVKELARKLNFTFTLTIPSNSSAGFSSDTKNVDTQLASLGGEEDASVVFAAWDKIIDLIKNKKVFLGACAFTITASERTMINFTVPISTESYVFLVSRPKELSRALLFIMPFTSSTWLCIIGAIVLIAPILHCIHCSSPFYEYYNIRTNSGLNKMTNCFWYVYGSMLQQGGRNLPTADSGRLVIGTWWLVVLIVVTTYCGNLVAFLTFPKMDSLITNIHDLLQRKHELTWGIPATSTLHYLIKASDDSTMTELYKGAILHKKMTSDVIDSVRKGKHVYIQRKTSLLFLTKREYLATNTCDFSLGSEEFLHEKLALGLALGSPYLNLINKEISQMHRVGLINKWLKDYLPMKDRCWSSLYSNEVNNHKVNLYDMQGSFFLLFLGFTIALLIYGLEFLFKKYQRSHERRVIQPFVT